MQLQKTLMIAIIPLIILCLVGIALLAGFFVARDESLLPNDVSGVSET